MKGADTVCNEISRLNCLQNIGPRPTLLQKGRVLMVVVVVVVMVVVVVVVVMVVVV